MKAQKIYLEHANITVSDMNDAIHFFQTAFPNFKIRGGGNEGKEWVHLGDDVTYVALNTAIETDSKEDKSYSKLGVNHIGFVVESVSEITDRLLEAGYKRDYPKEIEKFRIRDYFADSDGNQFEFVQYLSSKVEEKNSFND